jgi:hypothetical protein
MLRLIYNLLRQGEKGKTEGNRRRYMRHVEGKSRKVLAKNRKEKYVKGSVSRDREGPYIDLWVGLSYINVVCGYDSFEAS